MSRRYRRRALELFIIAAARLPWWTSLLIGSLSFFLLTWIYQGKIVFFDPAVRFPNEILNHMVQRAAWIARIFVPAIFLISTVIAGVKSVRRAARRRVVMQPFAVMESATTPFVNDPGKLAALFDEAESQAIARINAARRSAEQATQLSSRIPADLDRSGNVGVLLDNIEWRRFEALVERLFQLNGFTTTSQSHGSDGGVDIKLYLDTHYNDLVGVVQCKHWGRRVVGVELLRALRGSMAAFAASKGYFVSSSTFSDDALKFAACNGITVVDRSRLIARIIALPSADREALREIALQGDYSTPTCAKCGEKMVRREPRAGGRYFWGCGAFPRCRSVIRSVTTS